MQQIPSWGTASHSAGQEIPRVLYNPEVYAVFTRARRWILSPATCIYYTFTPC
jgi:hypothetical protein